MITGSSVKSIWKPRHFTKGETSGPKQRGFNELKALARVRHRFPRSAQAHEEMGRRRVAGKS